MARSSLGAVSGATSHTHGGGIVTALKWGAGGALFVTFVPMSVNRHLLWSPIIALAVAILIYWGKTALGAIRGVNPWLYVLLGYIGVSVLWSPYPAASINRTVLIMGLTLMTVAFLAPMYTSSWFTSVLRPCLTLLVLLSFIVALALPHYGTHDGGAWRGLTGHKNQLGTAGLLCAVLWTFRTPDKSSRLALRILFVSLCLAVMFFAESATSILGAVVLGLFLTLLFIARTCERHWRPVWLIALAFLLVVCHLSGLISGYPTVSEMMEKVAGSLGREAHLTGRMDLWEHIWTEAMRHPWLGVGYGGYWVGAEGGSSVSLDYRDWAPTQAHNGYLDVMNDLGIVGLGLLTALLISHGRRLSALNRMYPEIADLHVAIFLCALVVNMSESVLFRGPHVWTVAFLVSVAEVSYLVHYYGRDYGRGAAYLHPKMERAGVPLVIDEPLGGHMATSPRRGT